MDAMFELPAVKFQLSRDDDPSGFTIPRADAHGTWAPAVFNTLRVDDLILIDSKPYRITAIPQPPTNVASYVLCNPVEPPFTKPHHAEG